MGLYKHTVLYLCVYHRDFKRVCTSTNSNLHLFFPPNQWDNLQIDLLLLGKVTCKGSSVTRADQIVVNLLHREHFAVGRAHLVHPVEHNDSEVCCESTRHRALFLQRSIHFTHIVPDIIKNAVQME